MDQFVQACPKFSPSSDLNFLGDLRRVAQFKAHLKKATQIKAPGGRVNEKYMYTYFMVKMINLRSFGLFGSIWVGECARKDFTNFEFWGSLGQIV